METTAPETESPAWAIIEPMGHIRYGGRVSKDNQFGTAMLRVDVPQLDGSFVTQFINPQSLYRMTVCTEDLARACAASGRDKPVHKFEVSHLLGTSAPEPSSYDPEDEDEEKPDVLVADKAKLAERGGTFADVE